ncbi:MAG: hypothetical protein DMF84_00375 [Acidobacteria bacterium]|nr:MAG: hypothetical protein DMF84_00375 [Acidobacteriota bacterium]
MRPHIIGRLARVDGVMLGLVLGAAFGLWNLVVTVWNPLLDDSPLTLLMFYGPMFAIWGVAGYRASRRTGRLVDGVKVGATVAFVTFLVFNLAVILRVNLFLDALTERSDWRNLVLRFQASGFESLRTYANYAYLTGAPFKILVASVIGAGTGLVGGFVGSLGGPRGGTDITIERVGKATRPAAR